MADESEVLVTGSRFRVERRHIPKRGGGTEPRELVVHPGSVIVLPVLDDGRLVLIRNQRFTVEKALWELCAGTRAPGEPPSACAARELEEETGYRAATLTPLCDFFTAPGLTDERMFAFVATGLAKVEQRLDDTEQIEVHLRTHREALEMVRTGELEDAKSIAVLLYWDAFVRSR